jgi:tetratricopeptide (TPR) repeat protein
MVVVTMLVVLVGCATQVNKEPAAPIEPEPVIQGPTVLPLEDGRKGFIITEVTQLDDASRADFDKAVSMLDQKAYDQAIELLEGIIAQQPGVTAPYINLGIAYQQIGKPDQAEGPFKAVLELIPDHPVACNQYGLLFRKSGRFDDARKIYEQGLAQFPDYAPLHRNLGILCDLYLNELETALQQYEIYSQAVPEDDQVKLWIADLRARLGKN